MPPLEANSAPTRSRAAFSLIELLTVMVVAGVLAGLLLAEFARVRGAGQALQCVSNLKQWGVALHLYANDNSGRFPRRGQGVQQLFQIDRPEDWFNALPPYAGLPSLQDAIKAGNAPKPGDHSIFVCPAAPRGSGQYFLPYAMNMYLSPWIRPLPHSRLEIENPEQLAFLTDGPVAWASTAPSKMGYSAQARHAGRANVCFVDGHVAAFDGDYLGCGTGEPNPPRGDIHWQTDTGGVNQAPVP